MGGFRIAAGIVGVCFGLGAWLAAIVMVWFGGRMMLSAATGYHQNRPGAAAVAGSILIMGLLILSIWLYPHDFATAVDRWAPHAGR